MGGVVLLLDTQLLSCQPPVVTGKPPDWFMCSTSPLGSPGSTTAAVAVTAVALAATHFSMASVLPEAIAARFSSMVCSVADRTMV